jgi:tetratricopeptide (TPR) repeat protein
MVGVVTPTSLLLEVARTELAAGNLRQARSWFRRAADQAVDPVQLAQAAVGLGGIWVHEHRTASDHAAFKALVDRALVRLDGDRPDLIARLRTRRAAELIYTGHGSATDVRDAVDAARQLGDPLVLGEALSLWHHTLLGPANTNAERMGIADELIGVAAMAGDEMLGLMGVLWRAVDLYLIGDRRAERALAEARVRADALHVAAVLFVLDAIDVMRQLRDGHIDAAERQAQRCFELGVGIGDADAMGYYGGHLLTIRWLQMQPHEILPLARQVAQSPTLVEGDVAPRAAAAVLAAMLGDDDQARADLHHVMTRVPRSIETSSNWMITMFCAAEAAMMLSDLKTAEAVYSSLLPYRHLPIMGSLAVVCLGSAERSLGVAARTLGDVNLAVHHFEQALEQNHRLGNRVMAAISEGDLGCALVDRAMAGDVARGRAHVDAAVHALHAFSLVERARRLRADATERLRAVPVPDGEIVRSGATWRMAYGDHLVEIADSVGVQRLCQLLERPWIEVSAAQLAGGLESSVRHDVNDLATLRAYRGRIEELHRDIDLADDEHDFERAAQLRIELDELLDHLGPSIGLSGRSRAFADGVERARVAVRKSLGRVFDAVGEQDAEFAERLHDSIRTGVICRFEPVAQFPAVWHSSTGA